MSGWTTERRMKQAEAIQRWRPWERSTGPKSSDGKAVCAQNGYKGGQRPALRAVARALRAQAKTLSRTATC